MVSTAARWISLVAGKMWLKGPFGPTRYFYFCAAECRRSHAIGQLEATHIVQSPEFFWDTPEVGASKIEIT